MRAPFAPAARVEQLCVAWACRRQRRWGACSSGGGTVLPTKQLWQPEQQPELPPPTCARGATSARPASPLRSAPTPHPFSFSPPELGDTMLSCVNQEVQPVQSMPHLSSLIPPQSPPFPPTPSPALGDTVLSCHKARGTTSLPHLTCQRPSAPQSTPPPRSQGENVLCCHA